MNYQDLVDQFEAAKANRKVLTVSPDGKTVSLCDAECARRREVYEGHHAIRTESDLLGYEFSLDRPGA